MLPRDIEDACVRIGWPVVYSRYFPQGLKQPSPKGEVFCRSPFPFANDHNPSFELNVMTGLWRDWHTEQLIGLKGGNIVQFMALMNAPVEPSGKPIPDFPGTERTFRIELGLATPINLEWMAATQARLMDHESPGHKLWERRKPWYRETLAKLGIGWDPDKNRLVIPLHDHHGKIVNAKLYRPGADVKMLWQAIGLGGNFLFPYISWNDPWLILVEGEPDAISLRSLGFNGCSGTMGAGSPVPEGLWWHGKRVYIWMDADAKGQEAQEAALAAIRRGAKDVRMCSLPLWEGRPSNADASDFIMYLFGIGYSVEQVQHEIAKVLGAAQVANMESTIFDMEPVHVEFSNALTSRNARTRIGFDGHIVGKSETKYSIPKDIITTCPGNGFPMCDKCVMHKQWHGNARFSIDSRLQVALKLVMIDDTKRDAALKQHFHIPARCPAINFDVQTWSDMAIASIKNTLSDQQEKMSSFNDNSRYEALILLSEDAPTIKQNVDYSLTGYVWPLPSNQKQVIVVDSFKQKTSALRDFKMTPEIRAMLDSFIPLNTVQSALVDVADDISASQTMIYHRMDLHLMLRSVFHSVLEFPFNGSLYQRGWLEAMIIGDTRCGKSETFNKMAAMYRTGIFVDAKMQTPAGLLGSVETSAITGERYVNAGIFPQQDGAGPICLDEFNTTKWGESSILDFLSSTRSSGLVQIMKAAQATMLGRVPLIVMANPGVGRMMIDIGGYGVEITRRLIPQPEDIARFDMAMAVAQGDVPAHILNSVRQPRMPRWSHEAHRALLSWAWTRRPHQIVWADGAEQAVVQMAEAMCQKYDSEIPFVEPSAQRMRIAKLAVSVATQVFSSDTSGEMLIIRPEHVFTACSLFSTWYDKPCFGYDRYSQQVKVDRSIVEPAKIIALLDNVLSQNPIVLGEKMVRMIAFSERSFSTIIPMKFTDVHMCMQTLSANRCIYQSAKGRDLYELTPSFVRLLEEYIANKKAIGGSNAGP